MWAPADVEEIVRASFRFELMDVADCRVTQDEWVRCTVVGRYYREKDWEEGTCAPYQVRVDGVLPGCREEKVLSLAAAGDALIWIPRDSESYIRAASEERDERLHVLLEAPPNAAQAGERRSDVRGSRKDCGRDVEGRHARGEETIRGPGRRGQATLQSGSARISGNSH